MLNLVVLKKCLILNDDFQKIFSQRMLYDIMRKDSPSLENCMQFLGRDPNAFKQFINILIEMKESNIMDLLLNTFLGSQ